MCSLSGEHAELPDRPYVPEALLALAACLVACRLSLRLLPWADVGVVRACVLAGAALLVLAVVVLLRQGSARWWLPLACLVLAAAAAGLLASCARVEAMGACARALAQSSVSSWDLEVRSDPSLGRRGYRCRARATCVDADVPPADVWVVSEEPCELWSHVRCVGRFRPNERDDYGMSGASQGVVGTVSCTYVLNSRPAGGPLGTVTSLRRIVLERFSEAGSAERAVVIGSVCGDRLAIDRQGLDELFGACGVSHLVAVSGGHLAVVSAVLGLLLRRTPLPTGARLVLCGLLSGLFVVFCGAPVSALRSWAMALVAMGARLSGRREHALSSVSVVGLCMLLVSPEVSGQLGYLLSVYAVVGLCLFSRYVGYVLDVLVPRVRLPWRLPGLVRRVLLSADDDARGLLAATLTAQAATLPLTMQSFDELSLVAPVANVLLSLPFTVLIAAGMVAACLVPAGPLCSAALLVGDAGAHVALRVMRTLCRVPLATVRVPLVGAWFEALVVVLLVVLLVAWPRIVPRQVARTCCMALLVLAVLLVRWRWLAPARIVVLDVGQGDAILVQDGGAAMLVDTGVEGSLLEPLRREHVLHLDAVLLTHLHEDHVGGLADLRAAVPVDRVVVAEGVSAHLPQDLREEVQGLVGDGLEELPAGSRVEVGGFDLDVVWPRAPVEGDQNADSLELAVRYDSCGRELRALLTGDAEEDQTSQVASEVGDIDFLKVGHHGSAVSVSEDMARVLDPELAVASAGEGNSYGHPTERCVRTLEDSGATFLCTKDVGSVTVKPEAGGIRVSCERPGGVAE